jgi:tetratricopeptide (TPR) repeat protein
MNSRGSLDFIKLMLHDSTGKAYMKLGDWRKAAALFMKHIQLSPDKLSSWEELGIAYYKLGKYTSAIKSFRKALSGKKPAIRSQIFLSLTLSSLGNITESLSIFENLLQKEQGPIVILLYSKLILSFASWNLRRGASHNAFTLAKKAAVLGGKFVKRHGNNSMGHKVVGDANFLMTRVMHISIISREPISKARTVSLVEQVKMSMQSARRSFSKAVHLHPNSSPAWRDLAVPLSTWPNNNEISISLADRCLRSGIRLSPIHSISWKKLALAWASRNEAKALYGLKRALSLSKNDCESWVAFACLLRGQAIQNFRGYALQQGLQSGSEDLYHWHTLYISETKSISYDHLYRKQSTKRLALSCFSRTDFLSVSMNELRLSPVDKVFLNGWGLALARSGNWNAAANAHMFSLLTQDLDNSEDRTCYFLSRALTAVKYYNEEENRVSPSDPVLFFILNILRSDIKDLSVSEAVKADVLSFNQDSDSILFLDAILCLLRSKNLSCEEFYLFMKETSPGYIPRLSGLYPAMNFIQRFRFLYAEVREQFGKLELERALKALVDNDAVSSEAFKLVKSDAEILLEIIADLGGLRLRLKGSVDRIIIEKKFAKVLHATPWVQAKDVLIALKHLNNEEGWSIYT